MLKTTSDLHTGADKWPIYGHKNKRSTERERGAVTTDRAECLIYGNIVESKAS